MSIAWHSCCDDLLHVLQVVELSFLVNADGARVSLHHAAIEAVMLHEIRFFDGFPFFELFQRVGGGVDVLAVDAIEMAPHVMISVISGGVGPVGCCCDNEILWFAVEPMRKLGQFFMAWDVGVVADSVVESGHVPVVVVFVSRVEF